MPELHFDLPRPGSGCRRSLSGHRTGRGAANQLRILGQDARGGEWLARLPRCAAATQLAGGKVGPDLPPYRVDRNNVSVAQQSDGATDRGLGRNMSDHEPVAAAGKAPIGDQRDFVSQAAPDDGARGTQHFAHARTAHRTLVADDDDIARTHAPGKNGRGLLLLAVEHSGGAPEGLTFFPRDLGYRPFGSHVAVQDDQVALLPERLRERPHDVLSSNI